MSPASPCECLQHSRAGRAGEHLVEGLVGGLQAELVPHGDTACWGTACKKGILGSVEAARYALEVFEQGDEGAVGVRRQGGRPPILGCYEKIAIGAEAGDIVGSHSITSGHCRPFLSTLSHVRASGRAAPVREPACRRAWAGGRACSDLCHTLCRPVNLCMCIHRGLVPVAVEGAKLVHASHLRGEGATGLATEREERLFAPASKAVGTKDPLTPRASTSRNDLTCAAESSPRNNNDIRDRRRRGMSHRIGAPLRKNVQKQMFQAARERTRRERTTRRPVIMHSSSEGRIAHRTVLGKSEHFASHFKLRKGKRHGPALRGAGVRRGMTTAAVCGLRVVPTTQRTARNGRVSQVRSPLEWISACVSAPFCGKDEASVAF